MSFKLGCGLDFRALLFPYGYWIVVPQALELVKEGPLLTRKSLYLFSQPKLKSS